MLIGNPADFDRIRARYEALKYPTPEEASFNATRASYEGLLTGSGFDTQMVPTTTPGQQVSFSVDPVTGQVTTNVPEYEVPTFETIYDAGEGLIGADGRPIPDEVLPSMGQALSAQRGGGENRPTPEQLARQKQRSALINEFKQNPYLSQQLDPTFTTSLFNPLGFLTGFFDDSYGKLADDVLDSTSFVDDIATSTYTGALGTGGGGKPTTPGGFVSPSFSDVETGKFTGGKQEPSGKGPFGGANVGSHKDGSKGGKKTGTARF
tara:strand:- start:161 stop:952 length:792 start_codon:yes stop_codon:yes gene_type:complete